MTRRKKSCADFAYLSSLAFLAWAFPCLPSLAAEDSQNAELAKKLANPVAAMISVPFQFNYDYKLGPTEDGEKLTMNLQPVIPISLNPDWNIISRTIVPFDWQDEVIPGEETDIGIGDITQSLFFSPVHSDFIWGVGPIFLLPTGTHDLMSAEKWAAGPTVIGATQIETGSGHILTGVLANHLWDFAGGGEEDISSTFFQPFIAYTTPDAWTFSANLEGNYDWEANEASIPLNAGVSKVVKFGKLPVSLQAGVGYWLDSPEDVGPEGWRFRTAITLILPK